MAGEPEERPGRWQSFHVVGARCTVADSESDLHIVL